MKNQTEKAMWNCKTSDTPWTFSSLLKKAVCAILPDPTPVQDKEASKNVFELFSSEKERLGELPAFLDSRTYWEYQQWE
ncbi:TPA: hypothetical protein R9D00_004905, partial [Escherichia coli]|nr:hypothetical protein [Escherichia coli]